MRLFAAAILAVLAVAAAPAHALTGPNGTSDAKVLVIGLDGTRIDKIDALIEQGKAPNLKAIREQGFLTPSLLEYAPPTTLTLSEVGWSSIAAGVWPDKHGVSGLMLNMDPGQKTKNGYPDFLTAIDAANPDLSTFLASDWSNIGLEQNGGPIFGGGDARFTIAAPDSIEGYDQGDEEVTKEAAAYLQNGNPDAGFVYYGVIDESAHLSGSATPAYTDAITRTDARVGRLLTAIRKRPTYLRERWLVLLATDHGQSDFDFPTVASHGGGSDLERTSFIGLTGFDAPSSAPDPKIVDIAPTTLTWLGLTPAANLDGKALVQAADQPEPTATAKRKGKRLRITVKAPQGSPPLKQITAKGKQAKGGKNARKLTLKVKARHARVKVTDADGTRTTLRV